jgi:hypothetical protein
MRNLLKQNPELTEILYKPNYEYRVPMKEIFVNVTCLNRTPTYLDQKNLSQGGST